MNIRRYLSQTRSLPLHVLLRRTAGRLLRIPRLITEEALARLRPPQISDVTLQRALVSGVTVAQLPGLLRSSAAFRFFIDQVDRDKRIALLRQVAPDAPDVIVAEADRVCEHIFDLLGSGPTYLGERIDWHVDFKTGHRWDPRQYYADVRPAPYPGGYDIKVPWELSRCQHFAWIGQAYWFTEDEKYAKEFVAHVLDWIEQNPPQFGVNWACTMDMAIRMVNWLWGYYFFKDSPSLTDEFLLAFYKSLLAHGRHIIRNLEKSGDFTNNHYLSDLVGLVYLGILLPEFKEARRWREFGLQELEKEMFRQVYPDGVNFEASVSYHRLATELFLSAVLLAQLNGHAFSTAFMGRLEKMLEFVMYYTRPDGTVPLIGDSDNGRLHRLKAWAEPQREWADHRYLLAIGAVLFEQDDWGQAAGDQWEEAFWLLGERAVVFRERANSQPTSGSLHLSSRAFPDAGFYFLRHNDDYMAIRAGKNGQCGRGGHAHNDVLSFELFTLGRTWLTDSGMPEYTSDYLNRDKFRSTAAHNTVMINHAEQNRFVPGQSFLLQDDVRVRILKWEETARYCVFEAEHTGYERLKSPVIHQRIFKFDKAGRRWLICDQLQGQGEIRAHWSFIFPFKIDNIRLHETKSIVKVIADASSCLHLKIKGNCLSAGLEQLNIAYSYGCVTSATRLNLDGQLCLPYTQEFVLWVSKSEER